MRVQKSLPMSFVAIAVVLAVGVNAGCSDDVQPACTAVSISCQPLYVPTFANVYANTIAVRCGGDASSCHADSSRSGLSFATKAASHGALLLNADRVVPGDASCSGMIVRVFSEGHDWSMPPGAPLAAAERCALAQWVQNGAIGP
jgi:Planctomycete cytochrome C